MVIKSLKRKFFYFKNHYRQKHIFLGSVVVFFYSFCNFAPIKTYTYVNIKV